MDSQPSALSCIITWAVPGDGVVHVRHLWSIVWQGHDRLTKLVWCAGWTIQLVAVGLTISIPFWQAVIADTELTVMQQVGYEDSVLCRKFGFVAGTVKYAGCLADLLDLRHNHERLMADASLP
jgi:hypothetical protein